MAKYRHIYTTIWNDAIFEEMSPEQKLIFLCVLTNPRTTQCGIYEITMRQLGHYTGISEKNLISGLKGLMLAFPTLLQYDEKTREMCIVHWVKYNLQGKVSGKTAECVKNELEGVKSYRLIRHVIDNNRSDYLSFFSNKARSLKQGEKQDERRRQEDDLCNSLTDNELTMPLGEKEKEKEKQKEKQKKEQKKETPQPPEGEHVFSDDEMKKAEKLYIQKIGKSQLQLLQNSEIAKSLSLGKKRILADWLQHKKEIRSHIKTQREMDGLSKKFKTHTEKILFELVKFSAEDNSYKNLIWEKVDEFAEKVEKVKKEKRMYPTFDKVNARDNDPEYIKECLRIHREKQEEDLARFAKRVKVDYWAS